jgi:hypothetical protein
MNVDDPVERMCQTLQNGQHPINGRKPERRSTSPAA